MSRYIKVICWCGHSSEEMFHPYCSAECKKALEDIRKEIKEN